MIVDPDHAMTKWRDLVHPDELRIALEAARE